MAEIGFGEVRKGKQYLATMSEESGMNQKEPMDDEGFPPKTLVKVTYIKLGVSNDRNSSEHRVELQFKDKYGNDASINSVLNRVTFYPVNSEGGRRKTRKSKKRSRKTRRR
jgi:hypothetical protein